MMQRKLHLSRPAVPGPSSVRLFLSSAAVFCFVGLFAAAARGDLTVAGYEDRLHDRFYVGADRAFIGEPYNWSGVGRLYDPTATGGNWKSFTMISDNWFITANHFRPVRGDDPAGASPMVRFYRSNDPNGEYWESPLAMSGNNYAGTRIGNTDLWVGRLAETPPDWVLRYPLAKRHEATNWLSYTDNDLFVFGQDSPRSATSVRVGRNEVDLLGAVGNYEWDYDPPAGFGPDEAQTQGGDSGSPSFFLTGTVPVLAGVHTLVNYDTGLSSRLDEIQAAIGEPISVSTGLLSDVNGDFRVDSQEFVNYLQTFESSGRVSFTDGDVNGNGRIDGEDASIYLANFGKTLYAPSDFNRDGKVDGDDLAVIGDHWQRSVGRPFTDGDADGDGFVDIADAWVFERNQRRAYFGPTPPPLSPIPADFDDNGLVDGSDVITTNGHLNQNVSPGTMGDVNGDGFVDVSDYIFVLTHVGDSFGDINGDHMVDPEDFSILASSWNQRVFGGRMAGDLNGDGGVNTQDARILFDWWSVTAGGFLPVTAPEPHSVILALIGLFICSLTRRRRLQFQTPS